MRLAAHPLHRSGRAALPHPAPVLGVNGKPPSQPRRRIWLTDSRRRYPMANQPLKALPRQLAFLAPARKCVVPQVLDVVDKAVQRGAVERHSIILVVPSQHRSDPLALLFQWIMHSSPKLLFQSFQLRLHSLPHRLAHYREPSPSRLPADVREAQKVERLRFPLASTLPIPHCMPAELDQPSLFFMQRQLELSQSLTP